MKWALVKDGEVYNVGYLPRKFLGIPEPQLKQNGWHKIVPDTTKVKPWQTSTSNYNYDSVADEVTETKVIVDIPLADWKTQKYNQLKEEVLQYVYSITPPYKQTSALLALLDPINAAYTQEEATQIRDFATQYTLLARQIESDIQAMLTHQEVNDVYFRKNTSEIGELEVWVEWGQ